MCTLGVVGHWIGWNPASQRKLCKQQMKQQTAAFELDGSHQPLSAAVA